MANKSYDYLFKILLLGDSGVEKSKILFKFAFKDDDNFISTIVGSEAFYIPIPLSEVCFNTYGSSGVLNLYFFIRDTAGQERFHTITTSYYRAAAGMMVVYDITQEKTFENISKWLRNIEEYAPEDAQVMIVGNNCHMENKRAVTKGRGEQMAKENGLRFFEVSAETNENINEAFYTLAEDILTKRLSKDSEELSSNVNVRDNPEADQKKGCLIV
ncbi:ras-related protein Rab-10-like [Actinia tenebrosa]|uniref:Ras-related protein Rab-10-like n=1 Tax=Actinia tenebrosa TaxID=6105 RepID=A0A6P8H6X8_ACTTE|nr:ras-related protein Rab-10-like [Actinia tenebrosa]